MLNPTLHEAGSGFARNINYPAQSQTEVQNKVAEAAPPSPDSTFGGKGGNKIYEEPNKSSENLYFCHHLTGGAAHPGIIVETAGLANIKPPQPVYRPCLPVELITSGKISQIQLERIIYAGQAHGQFLPESEKPALSWELFSTTGFRDESARFGSASNSISSKPSKTKWRGLVFAFPSSLSTITNPKNKSLSRKASFSAPINL
jgi:hypothetical protein